MAELVRTPKQLGNLVRRARKKAGLTQAMLGEKACLRQATISDIEAGNRRARLESILRVLAVLRLQLQIDRRSLTTPYDIENIR